MMQAENLIYYFLKAILLWVLLSFELAKSGQTDPSYY